MILQSIFLSFFGFPFFPQFDNSPTGQVEQLVSFQHFNEAIERADRFIEQLGRSAPAKLYRLRAQSLVNVGRPRDAIRDCEQVLKMRDGNEERKNAFLIRSNAYLQLGEPLKAESDAIQIRDNKLINKARDLGLHMKKADNLISDGRLDEAIPSLDILVSISPGAYKYKLLRAEIAWAHGDIGKFLSLAEELKDVYPNNAELQYKIGIAKFCQNDLTDALSILKKTQRIKGGPKNTTKAIHTIEAFKKEALMIDSYIDRKSVIEANQSVEKIESFAKKFCQETSNLLEFVHLQRVKVLKHSNSEGILDYLTEILAKFPESSDILLERAEFYLEQKNYDAAIQDFYSVHRKDPSNKRAVNGYNKAQKLQKEATYIDYYKVLNVTKRASSKEIENGYRAMAKKWHPDKFQTNPEKKKEAENMMKLVNIAYDILSDPNKKRIYDSGGDPDQGTESGFEQGGFPFNPFNIFNQFFQQGNDEEFGGGGGHQEFHFGNGGGFEFHFQF